MFNMVIFGPPGSGKGTQSKHIAANYHLAHISTGEIFRAEMRGLTELGLRVKSIVERGELVPDDILVDILRSGMKSAGGNIGFLFDGYPRTLRQADDLDKVLSENGQRVNLVLSLEVNEEEVVARLLKRAREEGRKDDTEEVIRNRMKVYYEQTRPLIEHYTGKGLIRSVNGMGSVEEIFGRICRVIDKHI